MQNLLITFGSTSLGQRVGHLAEGRFHVIFATSDPVPSFMENRFQHIPKGTDPTFAHELLRLCLDHDIRFLLPLGWSEIQSLVETKQLFEEYGIQVCCPDREQIADVLVMECPPARADVRLFADGLAVIGEQHEDSALSGLFAFSDSGDHAALCVV